MPEPLSISPLPQPLPRTVLQPRGFLTLQFRDFFGPSFPRCHSLVCTPVLRKPFSSSRPLSLLSAKSCNSVCRHRPWLPCRVSCVAGGAEPAGSLVPDVSLCGDAPGPGRTSQAGTCWNSGKPERFAAGGSPWQPPVCSVQKPSGPFSSAPLAPSRLPATCLLSPHPGPRAACLPDMGDPGRGVGLAGRLSACGGRPGAVTAPSTPVLF